MANPELIVKIGGNSDKFRKELSKIEKESDASVKRMQKRAATASAVVAAAGAGALVAFNAFRDFERDFSNVVTLLDDTSFKTKTLTAGIKDLKTGIQAIAVESGQSFEVLNKALFDLISAGVSADKAITALGVATKLALAGGTDTSVAVDGITSALNAYNLEADAAQQVSEKFFTAQKFGKTTIEELAGSFGTVGATAASLNISLDEVLGTVSAVTTAGVGTSEAFTGLKAVMANVIKPTKDARIEAKALGIEFTAASLRSKGLAGFLDAITESAGFNDDSLGKLFGSVEALNVVTALAGNQADEFADTLAALGDEAGSAATFMEALEVKSETAQQAQDRFGQAIAVSTAKLGEFVAPAVITFLDAARDSVITTTRGFENLGVIIGGVATIMVESLGSAFAFILSGLESLKAQLFGFTAVLNDIAAKTPFLSDEKRASFEAFAAENRVGANRAQEDSENLFAQGAQFFTDEDTEAQLDRQRGFNEAQNELLTEQLEAQREIRLESKEQDGEAGLATPIERQSDEEFEETSDLVKERLEALFGSKNEYSAKEIAAAKKSAKDLIKIEEEKAKRLQEINDQLNASILSGLKNLFDEQTAVGKAIFLFEKARAIADTIINTQEAGMLAYASQLIPGDPTSVARAEAARQFTYIKGAVSVGVIGAQAIQGISAQRGGIVAGVGTGDTVPAMLEAGEIVVPKKFNPLSPTFEETFGGLGGNQMVTVDLNLNEDAARIITAQQRENKAIGVSR